jgi:hypothetical protein
VLTDWEKDFLASIGCWEGELTDRQQEKLAEIEAGPSSASVPPDRAAPGTSHSFCFSSAAPARPPYGLGAGVIIRWVSLPLDQEAGDD